MKNIFTMYDKSLPSERIAGMNWYANAHADARELHGNVETSSAIIAALSPGLRWERNIEAARRVIEGESLDGLGVRWYDGVWKAIDILHGVSPIVRLRGNKVRAFWQCLLDPFNRTHVCVDGHAYNIYRGRRGNLMDVPAMNDKLYHKIAGAYCKAAAAIGILPLQLQAITWCAYRRLNNIAGKPAESEVI